ncbi:3-oxoacyl-ACP synthase III [bacterium]|nr:3-oxoacyl-ACP synthase III [candidate division CSSED10-310 bacterium]
MRYSQAHIAVIGYALPDEIVRSVDLEARLETLYSRLHLSPGQLEALTGIRARRWWPAGFRISEGALRAAVDAIKRAGIRPRDIDVLIHAGVCRDEFEPATACHVAAGIPGFNPRAMVYDVSNACLGVINGIMQVANMIELGQARCGLVVSCESARDITENMIETLKNKGSMDYFRYGLATLTGGSGAVAVLVTSSEFINTGRRRILGGVQRAAPRHHMLCRWGLEPAGAGTSTVRQFMHTDSVNVLKYGVTLATETWNDFLQTLDWTPETIDRTICHQVGSAHQDTVLKTLGMPPEKDFVTYPELGNIGTVSLPITAAIADEHGHLKPGQTVGFLGIGSGLNCMMLGIEW